MIAWFFCDVSF